MAISTLLDIRPNAETNVNSLNFYVKSSYEDSDGDQVELTSDLITALQSIELNIFGDAYDKPKVTVANTAELVAEDVGVGNYLRITFNLSETQANNLIGTIFSHGIRVNENASAYQYTEESLPPNYRINPIANPRNNVYWTYGIG